MEKIYTSATKIVFLLVTLAVIGGFFVGKIDPKDFFALAMVVFYHYYNKPKDNTTQPVDKEVPQLG